MPQIDDPKPSPLSPLSPQANRLMGVAAVLAAVGILVGGVWLPLQRNSVSGWQSVPCRILESAIETRTIEEPWGNTTRTREVHGVKLRFAYDFAGQSHEGKRLTLGDDVEQRMNEERATEIVTRYPVGSEASCLVNPEQPDDAVLEAGQTLTAWLFLPAGLVVLLYGLALIATNRSLA